MTWILRKSKDSIINTEGYDHIRIYSGTEIMFYGAQKEWCICFDNQTDCIRAFQKITDAIENGKNLVSI